MILGVKPVVNYPKTEFVVLSTTSVNYAKFGLSEKHSKFEKNLPHGFDKSADLLSKHQNHEFVYFSESPNVT